MAMAIFVFFDEVVEIDRERQEVLDHFGNSYPPALEPVWRGVGREAENNNIGDDRPPAGPCTWNYHCFCPLSKLQLSIINYW